MKTNLFNLKIVTSGLMIASSLFASAALASIGAPAKNGTLAVKVANDTNVPGTLALTMTGESSACFTEPLNSNSSQTIWAPDNENCGKIGVDKWKNLTLSLTGLTKTTCTITYTADTAIPKDAATPTPYPSFSVKQKPSVTNGSQYVYCNPTNVTVTWFSNGTQSNGTFTCSCSDAKASQ